MPKGNDRSFMISIIVKSCLITPNNLEILYGDFFGSIL